ncbi:thiolase domain-containing protein [Acidobacteriia bacterium AH_259_A11_L15]|nr:thiolase domain-containing protein [Acidobacteriia bacterium AH_259_A11_L15]
MRDVSIIGVGQTPVGEHWAHSLRDLGVEATRAALADAGLERPDALFVGNMVSGLLCQQENLATLLADFSGFPGIEALKIEAACASGAAAVRVAQLAVASGAHDLVVAVGIEKMTDLAIDGVTSALATAADADYEAAHGVTFTALNALLMRLYMERYGYTRADFAPFVITAHENAVTNPYAMFRETVTPEDFLNSPMVAEPISILDSSPVCDGAAAVVLCPSDRARSFTEQPVKILASATATDTIGLAPRKDLLWFGAAYESAHRAYRQTGLRPEEVDFFELHDAFTIVSALSLEAACFAERGQGVRFAQECHIHRNGKLPICTQGGLKARGHPVGASGAYQIVEAVNQLRGHGGPNQVANCRVGMAQSIGGMASVAVTHILGV